MVRSLRIFFLEMRECVLHRDERDNCEQEVNSAKLYYHSQFFTTAPYKRVILSVPWIPRLFWPMEC